MKTIVLMAISVDGFVAGAHDDTSFVSSTEWGAYFSLAKNCDAIIIGRKTYDVTSKKEFVSGVSYFVITHRAPQTKKVPNAVFWHGSAKLLIQELRESGAKKILVAGGGQTNSLFLNEKLVDEIIVDVEGNLLEQGTKLFSRLVRKVDLKLLRVKKMGKNTVRLHYTVKKDFEKI